MTLASTSLVERLNASIRNFSSRFTRPTFKFSKKLSNHIHAQAIFVMYYNFVRQHDGLKGAERHWTPAMKAGRSNRLWSYDDLLNEVDEYWRHKAMQPILRVVPPRQYLPLAAGETSLLPYFVMYSPVKSKRRFTRALAAIAVRDLAATQTGQAQMSGMPSRPSGQRDGALRRWHRSSIRSARCV